MGNDPIMLEYPLPQVEWVDNDNKARHFNEYASEFKTIIKTALAPLLATKFESNMKCGSVRS
jgi:hypothetical protein